MNHPSFSKARGFTLIELMIAILIGLFLVGGLVMLVSGMRRATTSQQGLSQLQDNERMAMNIVTDTLKSAGYFPNPLVNSGATLFPATSVAPIFATAGQAVYGSHPGGTNPDSIYVRYTTLGNDGVVNCVGGVSSTQKTWTQTITVDTTNNNLTCTIFDGTTTTGPFPVVNGVTNLLLEYGVRTNTSALDNSVDTYLTADNMTTAYWNQLLSVRVTISFSPALINANGTAVAGQTLNPINFTRVITFMNKTGVDT